MRGFDVSARVAEGRQAVEHTQAYVSACHALGYQQPDLTAHASQVQDTYDAESGLDLKVLDDDCAALRAAVNAVEEALSVQRAQVSELATGWRGSGADSAMRFLQRHCDEAAAVAARVRSAAEVCATLRDNLWQAVDSKVATTVAIDERRAAERSAWLAAAHTITTGAGDRSVAEELIRRHVTPYVDNDIRNDWLSAVHSTAASIAASYDAAIHELTSAPDAGFEIPGDFGPSWQPISDEPVQPIPAAPARPDVSIPADPMTTVPAAAHAPPSSTMPEPQPLSTGGLDEVPPELAAPLSDAGGLSAGAGGLGGIAGGIGGVIGNIVDGIGSLIGSLTGGLGDTVGDPLLDDPIDDTDNPEEAEEAEDADETEGSDEPIEADAEPVAAAASEEPAVDQLSESAPAAVEAADAPAEPAAPPPVDPPPADQPPPPTVAPPDGSTPCEIAEDQLPQAGQ
jgi:hypothetical protein